MLRKTIVAIAFVASAFIAAVTFAEDAVTADPEHYTVEFENDRIRVIRIKYGPGEKSVMHTHGPNVAIFLTDGAVRMTMTDGTSMELNQEAGRTRWADAEEHLPQNVGDQPLELVLVELKD